MQYLGNFAEDATVYIPFNTFSSDDPQASVTITDLADADIKVHKDGGLTQIATDGATIAINYDGITGNHLISIDTSVHADYSIGSDYIVRIEGTTVDGGTINAFIASFSIENRFNDVNVVTVSGTAQTGNDNGADINTILSRIIGTLASGTHNPASAAEIAVLSDWINDGRLDVLLDAIPTTAMRGTDNAALASVATEARLAELDSGNLPSTTDDTLVDTAVIGALGAGLTNVPWNSAWDSEVQSEVADALAVFWTNPATLVDLIWDEVLTGVTHNITNSSGKRVRDLQEKLGYELGSIWIDTVNGVAGTEDFINGTVGNPVASMADANTLSASLNIPQFQIAVGSSITFAVAQNNQTFTGHNWTLALGGQDTAGSHIFGATVSGIAVGATKTDYHGCIIGICTLNQFHMIECGYDGTVTFGIAGDYIVNNGHSAIAGTATPIFDTGAAIANVNLSMPDWHNGVEIRNLNNSGSDLFSISGVGQIIFASSSSGAVNVRGRWKVTNTGGVTITYDDPSQNEIDILVDTNELQTDNIPGLIGALNDLSGSDILTQVNAALDTAISELGIAVPATTPTLRTGLMLMYMALRNRTDVQTSGTDALEIHNNAGTLITKKLLTDDGQDYSEAKMS